jgi:hypothetical protein
MKLPLLLAAIFSAPPAVERTREPAPADGPAITVRGELVTPEGQPVAGATVFLRAKIGGQFYNLGLKHNRDVLAQTTTGEEGTFAFDKVAIPPRMVGSIELLRGGNAGAEIVAYAPGRSLVWTDVLGLVPGEPIRLTLAPQTPIAGRVADESEAPIEGVKIRVWGLTRATNDIDSFFHASGDLSLSLSEIQIGAQTDADGAFRLPNVPPDYRVTASIERGGRKREYVVIDSGPPGDRAEVKFHGGGGGSKPLLRSPLDIKLQPHADVLIRVTDHLGRPVTSGSVQMTDSERRFAGSEALDKRGEARLARRSAGEYSVSYGGDPLSPRLGTRIIAKIEEGAAAPIEIKLPELRWLMGRVVDAETGTGICGVHLYYSLGADPETIIPPASSSVVSSEDGTFRIPVAVGKGRLTFQHEVHGYLVPTYAATPDRSQPMPGLTIEISANGEIAPVTLKLSRGLVVRGRVSGADGKPAAAAAVRGLNTDSPYTTRSAKTDAEGRFELIGLSPFVAALVTASGEAGSGHAKIAGQPDQPWDRTRVVEVPLTLNAGVTISGRVTFEGRGRAGVRLKLTRSIGAEKNRFYPFGELVSDAEGLFRVSGLDPGDRYNLSIEDPDGLAAPEWPHQSPYVQSVPEGKNEVTLPDAVLIRRGQNLRGIVVDPQGKPVADISVSARLANGRSLARMGEGPPPWTKTGADGRFELVNLPDQSIELIAYRANPQGGRIRFPALIRPTKSQQDIRILLDPTLTDEIEDLDAPKK